MAREKMKMARSSKKQTKPAATTPSADNGEGIEDDRFKEVQYSAKFARDPKDRNKVRIDSRFKQIFTDEDFASAAGPRVDKYGRKLSKKDRERGADLKRYYKLDSEDEDGDKDAENDDDEASEEEVERAEVQDEKVKGKKAKKKRAKPGKEESGPGSDDRLAYLTKLARGEVEDASSSDSEQESDSDSDSDASAAEDAAAEEEEEEQIPLGEATQRIAIQNLDWSRLRAQDILVALQSFLPVGGVIRAVTVYQSEFGEKRLKDEEMHGPRVEGIERREVSLDDPTNFEIAADQEANEGDQFDMEKLRKYELDKLKYYFAIAEFNTVEAADHVYKECDGVEFERSSIVFDLRFVPDGLEIERPVRDSVTEASEDYQAPDFVSKALQSTKVQLTWDEEEHDRMKLRRWRAKPQKGKAETVIGERELEAFIASDGDDDDEDEDEDDEEADDGDARPKKKDAAAKRRDAMAYRASLRAALLASDDEDDDDDNDDKDDKEDDGAVDHEFSYIPEDDEKDVKKGKKNSKKTAKKTAEPVESEDAPVEDDFKDSFFASEGKKSKRQLKKQQREQEAKRQNGGRGNFGDEDDDDEDDNLDEDARRKREQAELELLLLSEQDRKKGKGLEGFDFKAIVEGERLLKKKSKLRGKKRERKEEAVKAAREDDFNVDTADARFSTLYEDPDFAVDRTNSQYKETRGMRAFEQEQLRKRGAKKALQRRGPSGGGGGAGADADATDSRSDRLQNTVEAIKRRSAALEQAKKKRRKAP